MVLEETNSMWGRAKSSKAEEYSIRVSKKLEYWWGVRLWDLAKADRKEIIGLNCGKKCICSLKPKIGGNMKIPMQVTFRDLPRSEDVELKISEAAEKLNRVYGEIMSCRIVVDMTNRRHKKGNLYRIRIDVTVPGTELYVGRDPGDRNAHKDVFVAIRDAFNAMERQLQEYIRARRGEVKRGVAAPHGRISELFREQGYGFIETFDGRSIYFHRNSVLNNGFDGLTPGAEVRFAEEAGLEGPQASTVEALGKETKHDSRTHADLPPPRG